MDNVYIDHNRVMPMVVISEPGAHGLRRIEMTIDEARELAGELAGRLAGLDDVHTLVVRAE